LYGLLHLCLVISRDLRGGGIVSDGVAHVVSIVLKAVLSLDFLLVVFILGLIALSLLQTQSMHI
jgi:hypothetical protein